MLPAAAAFGPGPGEERSGRQPAEQSRAAAPVAPSGLEIVSNGAYPELRLDGRPFFLHAAAFPYFRVPRDLWERSLNRYLDLGFNTLDIEIPWNFHELHEGEFDFEGRTNPRRDLHGLLEMAAVKGFRLIARPAIAGVEEWRHGGYPAWLLVRPEFRVPLSERLDGALPPLAALERRDPESAAAGWLATPAHMAAVHAWLRACGRQLAPYSVRRTLHVTRAGGRRGETQQATISGPLIFVQAGDSQLAFHSASENSAARRYFLALREALESAGVNVPLFAPAGARYAGPGSPSDAAVQAAGGSWQLAPAAMAAGAAFSERILGAQDVASFEMAVERAKSMASAPRAIFSLRATAPPAPGDFRASGNSPANTLLLTRLLVARGMAGFTMAPGQDSLTPAAYAAGGASRHARWDAPLSIGGERRFFARTVERNAQLLDYWGEFLATSHLRADFGLVAASRAAQAWEQMERVARVAQLAHLSWELADPEAQPAEALERYAALLFPVLDAAGAPQALSEAAQRKLLDYVRRGGALVFFPTRPKGAAFEELWASHGAAPGEGGSAEPGTEQLIRARWKFGKGEVLESSKDFYSWVELAESYSASRGRFESAWAVQTLLGLLEQGGARPAVRVISPPAASADELLIMQRISNRGTEAFGERRSGQALLSITNLHPENAAAASLEILPPAAGARGPHGEPIPLKLVVPARESLLLPLGVPLCMTAREGGACSDEIVAAGAELLLAEREGRTLELTFYAPARAWVILKLARQPNRVTLDENKPEASWDVPRRWLQVEVLRGASPRFLRKLRIALPYTPQVPEKPKEESRARRDFDYSFVDTVRMPLTDDATLDSDPPLVVLDSNLEGRLMVQATNYDEFGMDMDVDVTGAVRGSGYMVLEAGDTRALSVKLKGARDTMPAGSAPSEREAGVLRGEVTVKSGRDRRTSPVFFLRKEDEKSIGYRYDFDRDASPEWVLENAGLRLIATPETGGAISALVGLREGFNLITFVGAFRDSLAVPADGQRAEAPRDLHARAYTPEWTLSDGQTALRLRYAPPDVAGSPAMEKVFRLKGDAGMDVEYALSFPAAATADLEARLISSVSIPADASPAAVTRFCWRASRDAEPSAGDCREFSPRGAVLEQPEGARRLDVLTPGRPGLAFEWPEAARAQVEMKTYSATVRFHFASLSATSGKGVLHLEMLPVP
jgi:hypothetical protein